MILAHLSKSIFLSLLTPISVHTPKLCESTVLSHVRELTMCFFAGP